VRISVATEPGTLEVPSEDWHYISQHVAAVLDGATVRTETGCVHGVPWYVERLGNALVSHLTKHPRALRDALRQAIADVRGMHPHCDLSHPGTPSAGVGIVVDTGQAIQWLVLGDVTIAIDTDHGLETIVDERVSRTAPQAREEADRYPIGSDEKTAALLRMKEQELAARNTPHGYWIAAADPAAADHALLGTTPHWARLALLTDGAGRAHAFRLLQWAELFKLLDTSGPASLIRAVRRAEESDPYGERWPRNKKSDDATAVYARPDQPTPFRVGDRVHSQWDTQLVGRVVDVIADQTHLRIQWDGSPTEVEMPASELFEETPTTNHGDTRE
jgi:hypothetical protein